MTTALLALLAPFAVLALSSSASAQPAGCTCPGASFFQSSTGQCINPLNLAATAPTCGGGNPNPGPGGTPNFTPVGIPFGGTGVNAGTANTVLLTRQEGSIATNSSQVSIGAVNSVQQNIRDGIQSRGRGGNAGLMRYTYDPNSDDDALNYTDPKSPSRMPVFKAMPKAPVVYGPRYAVWGQGFGDYEWRSGTFAGVDIGRQTSTVGGLGGADVTFTSILGPSDAYVIGVLGGYTSARVRNNDGSSAAVNGPGVGVYSVYVNGGFSTDSVFKADFFGLNRSAAGIPDLGTNLTNYTSSTNLNYKFDMMPWWVEPTVGVTYTATQWDGASQALGFQNGHTWRAQGGVRVGTTYDWNGVRVEPTLTGLAYSDVEIRGGSVAVAVGAPGAPNDEGKWFGQGIGKLNFIWNAGFSSYLEAEVRGREGVFATAGRAGLRWTW